MAEMNDIYSVARVRVKEKYLLTDQDIEQLLQQKDEAALLGMLSDKGWAKDVAEPEAHAVLASEEARAMADLRDLCPDPEILEVLEYPEYYHNLKTGIKEICTEGQHPGAFYESIPLGRKEILEILREKTYDKLPDHMRSAARNAYETMTQTMDGQMCDVMVDRACLCASRDKAAESRHDILKDYVEQLTVTSDIRIALRGARTGKSVNFLKAALAPCASFDAGRMAVAAAEGVDALYAFLDAAGFGEAVEALKQSDPAFEKWCDDRVADIVKPHRRNTFGVGPIVAYYLARKNEIKTVRMMLTAKANGLSEKDIRERIRRMYV